MAAAVARVGRRVNRAAVTKRGGLLRDVSSLPAKREGTVGRGAADRGGQVTTDACVTLL